MGKKNKDKDLTREVQKAQADEFNALLDAAMRGEDVSITDIIDVPKKKKYDDDEDDFDNFKDSLMSAAIGALASNGVITDLGTDTDYEDDEEEPAPSYDPQPWLQKHTVIHDRSDLVATKNKIETITVAKQEEVKIERKPIPELPDDDDDEELGVPETPTNANIPDMDELEHMHFVAVDPEECLVDIYRRDGMHVCELDTFSLNECAYDYEDESFQDMIANLETAICFVRKPDIIAFADTELDENRTTFGQLMKRVTSIDKNKWIISPVFDVPDGKTTKTCYVVYYMDDDAKTEMTDLIEDLKEDNLVLDFMVNIAEMAKAKLFNPIAYDLNRSDYLENAISYPEDLKEFKDLVYAENGKSLTLDFNAQLPKEISAEILHAEYSVLMENLLSFQDSIIKYMVADADDAAVAEPEPIVMPEETLAPVVETIDDVEIEDVSSDDIEIPGVKASQMIEPIRI